MSQMLKNKLIVGELIEKMLKITGIYILGVISIIISFPLLILFDKFVNFFCKYHLADSMICGYSAPTVKGAIIIFSVYTVLYLIYEVAKIIKIKE